MASSGKIAVNVGRSARRKMAKCPRDLAVCPEQKSTPASPTQDAFVIVDDHAAVGEMISVALAGAFRA